MENTLESLNEAVELAPTNPGALAKLASLLLDQHPTRQEEARALAERAMAIAPDDDDVRRVAERARSLR